jgi:SRSO17 transposase
MVNCNSIVFSGYQDDRKTYPLDLRAYRPAKEFVLGKKDPEFKDKITLAIELFDAALERELEFSHVLFDSWYFSERLVNHIESKGC